MQRAAALQSLQEKTNWSWAFALRQLSPLALQVSALFYSITSGLVILILSDLSKQWNLIVPDFRRSQDTQSVDFVLKVWEAFVAQLLETEQTWTIPGRSGDHGHLSVGVRPKNIVFVYITAQFFQIWHFSKADWIFTDKTAQADIREITAVMEQLWGTCAQVNIS